MTNHGETDILPLFKHILTDTTDTVEALVSEDTIDICSVTIGNVRAGFVVPYILTIIYEIGMANSSALASIQPFYISI